MTIITDRKKGFTLAEVLITLTIIGVVAALTIPGLLANINDKTYASKRKGLATRMAQAMAQIGTITAYEAIPPSGNTEADYALKYSSMNFVVEALSKAYSISTICDYDNLDACDFPKIIGGKFEEATYRMSNMNRFLSFNSTINTSAIPLNTYGALFRTKNGESIFLFYNPKCTAEQDVDPVTMEKSFVNEICVHMLYDLDGARKGPNIMGKDIGFMALMYADQPQLFVPSPPDFRDRNSKTTSYPKSFTGGGNDRGLGYICSVEASPYSGTQGTRNSVNKEMLYALSMYKFFYTRNSIVYNEYYWSNSVEGDSADDYGWTVQIYKGLAKKEARSVEHYTACIGTE